MTPPVVVTLTATDAKALRSALIFATTGGQPVSLMFDGAIQVRFGDGRWDRWQPVVGIGNTARGVIV